MRSPAAAVAWAFRQRHRWGLIAVTGYLLGLATIRFLFLEPGQGIDFEDAPGFALAVVVPLTWPARLAASLLAWTQALTWMSYPLRGLRVIITVLWLTVIDAVVMVALEYKASEPVMLAILAPHVPLAYLAARFAVARARR